jgi:hypothetical protein
MKKMITTNIIVGEIDMMRRNCDYDYDYDDDYYRISHGPRRRRRRFLGGLFDFDLFDMED